MNFRFTSRLPRCSAQIGFVLFSLIALFLWLVWLSINILNYRQEIASQRISAATPNLTADLPLVVPLNSLNISTMLGFATIVHDDSQPALPLTLIVCIQGRQAQESRALIQYGESRAFYAQGDRLPDGAQLKTINRSQVVIVRNGREQNLTLFVHKTHLLVPQNTPREVADGKATIFLHEIESKQ
jgi:general secretion pathway protein C